MSIYQQITFTDADIANIDDCIYRGEYNPNNIRPWLLHDHGFVVAVVFASGEQDALDIAVDENKMDRYLISDKDLPDYGDEEDGVCRLGNASEPFDIDTLGLVPLPIPRHSFCAHFDVENK